MVAEQQIAAMEARLVSAIDTRIGAVESVVTDLGAKVQIMQKAFDKIGEIGDSVASLDDKMISLEVNVHSYTSTMDTEKRNFVSSLNAEFDQHKAALQSVVNAARDEFAGIKATITDLHSRTSDAFHKVQAKVDEIEGTIGLQAGPTGGTFRVFIPIKSMTPKTFGKSEDEWRKWQDDTMDFMDNQRPGMREFLKMVERTTGVVDASWVAANQGEHPNAVTSASVHVYRALKALTEGEARQVVQAVAGENGFAAWNQLHRRFGLSVAAKQGKAVCDVTSMVAKPAKSVAETRTLVTELERRVRVAEDIIGKAMDEVHVKAILASVLDGTTRAHTSQFQGVSTSYEEFKRAVLEFCNNNILNKGVDPDAMLIGKVCEDGWQNDCQGEQHPEEEWSGAEQLAAVSASTRCHRCQGYGHIASQCPSPKGPGKGGGVPMYSAPGYGKAKGKGWQTPSPKGQKGPSS